MCEGSHVLAVYVFKQHRPARMLVAAKAARSVMLSYSVSILDITVGSGGFYGGCTGTLPSL